MSLGEVLSILGVIGVILTGLAYAYVSIRKGIAEAASNALDLANKELNLYKDRAERLEEDLTKTQRRVTELEARVGAMKAENDLLREVARGDILRTELGEARKQLSEVRDLLLQEKSK